MMKLEKNAQPTAATSCSRCRGSLSQLASILSQPASIIQKRCRAAQEKVDVAMSRNRSLRMSPTSFLSMSPGSGLEISLGNFMQQACRGPANRPPPADAIQSSMTIGSAI
jgi:hypothetical protein